MSEVILGRESLLSGDDRNLAGSDTFVKRDVNPLILYRHLRTTGISVG
jgi:hypothetical protein